MSRLRRLARRLRAAGTLWKSGGGAAVTAQALASLRGRLGLDELEKRVEGMSPAVSTWPLTSWIEQAALHPTPLVSVILPTHDRAGLLPRAVASVRAQVYPAWEIVLVDDGSTDATPAVAERLRAEVGAARLQTLRVAPGGVCAARNHGLATAKGSLIAYLDDDNVMHPLWLKAVAWAFAQRPDVDVVYGGIIIDDLLRVNRRSAGALPSYHLAPFDRGRLASTNLADIGAIAHRRGLSEAHFDETLREMGDWDLLIRLTRDKAPLVLPAVACFYHTDSPNRLSGGPTFEADQQRVRTKAETR
ncbi:MAG: glycosyltransferase family 2 protein [Candidatus Rokuibacteriota bacterium]